MQQRLYRGGLPPAALVKEAMAQARVAPSSIASAARKFVEEPRGLGMTVVFALWFMMLFEPHWYVAAKGPAVALKVVPLMFGSMLLVVCAGVPMTDAWQRRWQWFPPLLLYIAVATITVPFAGNIGYARIALQGTLLWWVLIVGTSSVIDSGRRAEILVTMYGLQFLWWAAWGAKSGLVIWHHSLSNYDGFGAFNVGGAGICYFLAMATKKKFFKWAMYATAGLCAMGVVASFARGAFLALMLVFFMVWLRSPHKGKTFAAMIGALAIVSLAASFLFEDGFFWNEIMSAFHEGNDEGTGHDRWILWTAAWRVFEHRPIFGAGLENWGVMASTLFRPGELPSDYANPSRLYDMSLHNVYVTVLSETGLVGSFAFIWIFVDFWKRNREMRTEAAQQQWEASGGKMNLRTVALGIEASMIAFMANAAMYAMMSLHWFWTMLALNMLLHNITVRRAPKLGRVR
jgi:putative inorganic carbon (hco3(-)) transporter